METGAIIGIVVGAVVLALILFCVCGHLRCCRGETRVVYVNRESTVLTLFRSEISFVASWICRIPTTCTDEYLF